MSDRPDTRDDARLLDELSAALRADDHDVQPDPERMEAFRRAAAERRGAAPTPARPGRRHRRPWRPPGPRLAAALAVAVAFALVAVGAIAGGALDSGDDQPAGTVEYAGPIELPGGAPAGRLEVREIGIGRTVDLRTDALPILPRGEFYEVWFVGPGDTPARPNRISAGTFHPDAQGRSDVELKAAVDPALYPRVVVTAEPGDGDPAAIGPEVMRARIAR